MTARVAVISFVCLICIGAAQTRQPQHVLVVQNYYYALPGKAEEVYRWRLHASDVREKLGLPRGRVLHRVADSKTNATLGALPDVVWECEYPSAESREADVTQLDKSLEFAAVERHMDTLLRDFRRLTFETSDSSSEVPAPEVGKHF